MKKTFMAFLTLFSMVLFSCSDEDTPENLHIPTVAIPATGSDGFWMGTGNVPGQPNYWSGSTSSYDKERPVHKVILSAFRMSVTEITNAQYAAFLNAKGIPGTDDGNHIYGRYGENDVIFDSSKEWDGKHDWGLHWNKSTNKWEASQKDGVDYSDYPAIYVTWHGAVEFCNWMSVTIGQTWRLPTESEWEYACRAGTETAWYSGALKTSLYDHAWFFDNGEDRTHPVGLKGKNAFGLQDMLGNVEEWCKSKIGYEYPDSTVTDPGYDTGVSCVLRGGKFKSSADVCRSGYRSNEFEGFKTYYVGFRVICRP